MGYSVKEIYYTLQGEGAHTGRPSVFCRFAGCNLWSGREEDRTTAVCRFCDTDFVGTNGPGGGHYPSPGDLAAAVLAAWPGSSNRRTRPFVVCTGGEPLLQMDPALIDAFHGLEILVAVETNGTVLPPPGIDWICVSPKAGAPLAVTTGDELKLVFPQAGAEPELFEHLNFSRLSLQPMDGPERERNSRVALEYCLAHPRWSLSLQTHKILRIS
jgi:7-carboxy-7-deazaguanine synthase